MANISQQHTITLRKKHDICLGSTLLTLARLLAVPMEVFTWFSSVSSGEMQANANKQAITPSFQTLHYSP
jgi:hypothetical protein